VHDGRRAAAIAGPVQVEQVDADVLTATATSSGVSATATAVGAMSDLHHLTGVASASVASSGAADLFAAAGANFVSIFTLDAVHDYRFSGTGTGQAFGFLIGYVPNVGQTGGPYFSRSLSGLGGFEQSGRLQTGTYLFEVATGVGANSWEPMTRVSSSYDFTFDLTASPVPEPGSMLLLGSGLIGLVVRRRIRANRP
jgi:hypothetical protein